MTAQQDLLRVRLSCQLQRADELHLDRCRLDLVPCEDVGLVRMLCEGCGWRAAARWRGTRDTVTVEIVRWQM